MAIKDEGTFSLNKAARDLLRRLGSRKADEISWRDMWAFIAVKGSGPGAQWGEKVSKSPNFSSWGKVVRLKADVPLSPVEEAFCQKWPNSDETT